MLTPAYLRDDSAENSIMQTITIAVSAILIAAGLVTAPGLINNARDNNARGDLANIAYTEEFLLSDTGKYTASLTDITKSEKIRTTLSLGKNRLGLFTGSDCYAVFGMSKSGKMFYRTSASAETFNISTSNWSTTKPTGYPVNCEFPTSPSLALNATPNLAATGSTVALGNAAITRNIAINGQTWTRVVPGTTGHGVRGLVPLDKLKDGQSYDGSFIVYNDGTTPVDIILDWSDREIQNYSIAPGETKFVNVTGSRDTYNSTYRFVDIAVVTMNPTGLLFKDFTVKEALEN